MKAVIKIFSRNRVINQPTSYQSVRRSFYDLESCASSFITKQKHIENTYSKNIYNFQKKHFPRVTKSGDASIQDDKSSKQKEKASQASSTIKEDERSKLSKYSKENPNKLDSILNKQLKYKEEKTLEEEIGVFEEMINNPEPENFNELDIKLKQLTKEEDTLASEQSTPSQANTATTHNKKPKKENLEDFPEDIRGNKILSKKRFMEVATSGSNKYESNDVLFTKKDFPLYFSSNDERDLVSDKNEASLKFRRLHELDIKKNELISYNSIMEIPESIQKSAHRVFSKYSTTEIKEWSKKYLLNYSQNHASEPPLNLDKLKKIPFGNSQELDIKTKIFNISSHEDNYIKNDDDNKENSSSKANVAGEEVEGASLNKKKENLSNPYLKIEYNPAYAVAYLYSRMPYTFNIVKRILTELKTRNPSYRPTSVLDYGAGLGSGVLAALDVFKKKELQKVAAVEPNKYMRKLGRYISDRSLTLEDPDSVTDIMWVESLAMLPGSGGMERGKFDLIILSHVLQEIRTAKSREMIIDTLYSRLSSNGVFVCVEPGSPKGYRFINDLREWIIEKRDELKKKEEEFQSNSSIEQEHSLSDSSLSSTVKKSMSIESVNILAPCPHALKCPLADKSFDWCHFSQLIRRYSKNIIPRVKKDDDLKNEKYSYLVIKKGEHILNRIDTVTDESELTIPELSFKWGRLVRPTIKKQKHTIIDVCTREGSFERKTISYSHGRDEGYKIAKRLKWGDLWMFPERIPNKYRKEHNKAKRLW
mmetsp:Transcript_20618/g.21406  ORF Transcript_20618/g.21406 Transcript_20618/m.21406 type:complete len:762 (+) Transcript_20618:1-2286(+)